MKLRNVSFVSLIAIALCTATAWSQIPDISPFSADMSMTMEKGQTSTGKMFWGGKHMRMEMSMMGHDSIILTDMTNPNNPTTTMLMPQQKMYMQMSAYGAGPGRKHAPPQVRAYDPNNPCATMEGTTCQKVGVETVNGYVCDKWEFTGKENETVWISQELHFPIKTVTKEGTVIQFTNIKQGPQDPSLFAIPSGYQKMDMGAMMGGRTPQ